MKRLIALLVGLTVLLSMSLTSFAAFSDEIALNADGITYTAALTGDAATANAGKQTTIVAYKGDSIEVGSIQYIDQAAQTSFTFQLMDELTENVKVVMGGEAIDKQEVGTIFFEKEDPTYTISGSIATTSANKAGTVTLTGAETYTAAIVDGAFEIEGVLAGDYTFAITKDAHITYTSALAVSADREIAELTLFAGDTDESTTINVNDFTAIGNSYGDAVSVSGDAFDYTADTDGSETINVNDFTPVGNNYGKAASTYAPIQ